MLQMLLAFIADLNACREQINTAKLLGLVMLHQRCQKLSLLLSEKNNAWDKE